MSYNLKIKTGEGKVPNKDKAYYTPKVPAISIDEKGNEKVVWAPLVVFPDGSKDTKGIVLLSDSVDENLTASVGMTAFTPSGAKILKDDIDTKVSKIDTNDQEIASKITVNNDFSVNGSFLIANNKNQPTFKIISSDSSGKEIIVANGMKFNGNSDVNFDVKNIPANVITGTISIDNLPQSVLERLYRYDTLIDADNAYKEASSDSKPFRVGDTILTIDSNNQNHMFIVANLDDNVTELTERYIEYSAGTAFKLGIDTIGSKNIPIYLKEGIATPITTLNIENGGTSGNSLLEAANNLLYSPLVYNARKSISGDLNEITDAGCYVKDNRAMSSSNTPDDSISMATFLLDVYHDNSQKLPTGITTGSYSYGVLRQRLRYIGEDFDIWERIGKRNSNNENDITWTDWKKINGSGGSGGANTGVIGTPGGTDGFDVSTDFLSKSSDEYTESENIISGKTSSTAKDVFTYDISDLTLGAYSIITRAKVSNVSTTTPFLTYIVSSVYNGTSTILKTVSISPNYFQEADSWECLSFGVNFNAQKGSVLRIKCTAPSLSSSLTFGIDYVKIIPSGTALGSIG